MPHGPPEVAREARLLLCETLRTLRLCVDLSSGTRRDVRLGAALRVDEVRREEGVDERRLAETCLA